MATKIIWRQIRIQTVQPIINNSMPWLAVNSMVTLCTPSASFSKLPLQLQMQQEVPAVKGRIIRTKVVQRCKDLKVAHPHRLLLLANLKAVTQVVILNLLLMVLRASLMPPISRIFLLVKAWIQVPSWEVLVVQMLEAQLDSSVSIWMPFQCNQPLSIRIFSLSGKALLAWLIPMLSLEWVAQLEEWAQVQEEPPLLSMLLEPRMKLSSLSEDSNSRLKVRNAFSLF